MNLDMSGFDASDFGPSRAGLQSARGLTGSSHLVAMAWDVSPEQSMVEVSREVRGVHRNLPWGENLRCIVSSVTTCWRTWRA
jgi:hypothetical protein